MELVAPNRQPIALVHLSCTLIMDHFESHLNPCFAANWSATAGPAGTKTANSFEKEWASSSWAAVSAERQRTIATTARHKLVVHSIPLSARHCSPDRASAAGWRSRHHAPKATHYQGGNTREGRAAPSGSSRARERLSRQSFDVLLDPRSQEQSLTRSEASKASNQ